jgi:hypothetical protein
MEQADGFSLRFAPAKWWSTLSADERDFQTELLGIDDAFSLIALTPFPATLPGASQLAENKATLSSVFANLTRCISHKSGVCHS